MIECMKLHKPIRQMEVGEEGYLQIGSLLNDERGRVWLNLNGKVSENYGGLLTPAVKRVDSTDKGFDVDTITVVTPYMGISHILHKVPDMICLDEETESAQVLSVSEDNHAKEAVGASDVVSPLYNIFMNTSVFNEVLIRTSVPEVIRGEKPAFSGVILYGKGGTGKTALQKAIAQVYERAGAHSVELNVASLSEKYVGSLAHNLDEKIAEINNVSIKSGRPAYIFLDEATSLVISSEAHNSSGMDYYQEAVDVLKKYISNYPNLVFSITTNAKPDIFDDTLIREGRLAPVHIPSPGEEEKKAMWKHFMEKHDVVKGLNEEHYTELATIIPGKTGAFISEFCRSYVPRKKLAMETAAAGSKNLLDALARGSYVSLEDVRCQITFEGIKEDINALNGKSNEKIPKSRVGFI